MPDISMCKYKECPKSETCYRFTAKPNSYQGYSDFKRICPNHNYEWYWHIETKTVVKVDEDKKEAI